jgi:hypothetical protein
MIIDSVTKYYICNQFKGCNSFPQGTHLLGYTPSLVYKCNDLWNTNNGYLFLSKLSLPLSILKHVISTLLERPENQRRANHKSLGFLDGAATRKARGSEREERFHDKDACLGDLCKHRSQQCKLQCEGGRPQRTQLSNGVVVRLDRKHRFFTERKNRTEGNVATTQRPPQLMPIADETHNFLSPLHDGEILVFNQALQP